MVRAPHAHPKLKSLSVNFRFRRLFLHSISLAFRGPGERECIIISIATAAESFLHRHPQLININIIIRNLTIIMKFFLPAAPTHRHPNPPKNVFSIVTHTHTHCASGVICKCIDCDALNRSAYPTFESSCLVNESAIVSSIHDACCQTLCQRISSFNKANINLAPEIVETKEKTTRRPWKKAYIFSEHGFGGFGVARTPLTCAAERLICGCVETILWNKFTLSLRLMRVEHSMQAPCGNAWVSSRTVRERFLLGIGCMASGRMGCAYADDEKNFWQIENLLINLKIIMRDFQFIFCVARHISMYTAQHSTRKWNCIRSFRSLGLGVCESRTHQLFRRPIIKYSERRSGRSLWRCT